MSGTAQCAGWKPIGLIGFLIVTTVTPLTCSVPKAPAIGLRCPYSPGQTTVREAGKPGGHEAPIAFDVEFEMHRGDSGVLLLGGNDFEIFALYVQTGRAILAYQNFFQGKAVTLTSDDLPAGTVKLQFELGPVERIGLERRRKVRMFVNGACLDRTPLIEYSIADDDGVKPRVGTEEGIETLLPDYTFTGEIRSVEPHRASAR